MNILHLVTKRKLIIFAYVEDSKMIGITYPSVLFLPCSHVFNREYMYIKNNIGKILPILSYYTPFKTGLLWQIMAPMTWILGVVLLMYWCSHIATDQGSHRAQMSYLCTYSYLLLYAYKAYMINISTSLNLIWGNGDL